MFKLGGIDLETTGLDQEAGHRIIEIGFCIYRTTDGVNWEKIGSTLCKRLDPKRAIDEKAQKVHGITRAELVGLETWEDYAPKMGKMFSACNAIVAHNADFDIPFIVGEFDRVMVDCGNPDIFCTMENGRSATPLGSVPSLKQLCWAFGIEYNEEEAHNAAADIDWTMECFFEGLRRGYFHLDSLNEYLKEAA